MLRSGFNTGTINRQAGPGGSSPPVIWEIHQRVEDDLEIQLAATATGYRLDIVLKGRALEQANRASPDKYRQGDHIRLATYDQATETLETHPMSLALGSSHLLEPKYNKIRSIKFEGVGNLHDGFGSLSMDQLTMPSGFVRDIFAGFGLLYELRSIVDELERLGGFTELVLTEYFESSIQGTVAHIRYAAFDEWRRTFNRAHNKAVTFEHGAKLTYLGARLESELGLSVPPWAKGDPSHLAEEVLLALQVPGRPAPVEAATAVVRDARSSACAPREQASELLALNREIELLTLEQLIERLETHIAGRHREAFWQKFLSDNPFIIRLAFGLPVAVFGEQVAMGGVKFDGSGGKIADYLVHAGSFGNMAIIEIKTPDTGLLNLRHYRGGVYAPSKEIAGAVTQILDQRFNLHLEINNRKAAARQHDVFTYAMQGVVIAGRDLDDPDQRKSFELFRNGLKDITVITFSELLLKLKALHSFLVADEDGSAAA